VWICLCEAVNSSTICAVIHAGARSVQAVGEACGAGTVCGKCKRNIARLLDQPSDRNHASEGGVRQWRTTPRW
jgi:bacterioferritin-associated ferredoxin